MIPAENLFNALFSGNFATPFNWKKTALGTDSYDVQFPCKIGSTTSMHTIKVFIKDGKHYILESSLLVFRNQLKIKK